MALADGPTPRAMLDFLGRGGAEACSRDSAALAAGRRFLARAALLPEMGSEH